MRNVGINALVLNEESGGLGVYLRNLIKFLISRQFEFDPRIFLSRDTVDEYVRRYGDMQFKRVNIQSNKPVHRIVREPFIWPKLLKENNIELLHSTLSYIPMGISIPSIVTIHDLGFFHYPEHYTLLRRMFLERMIMRSVDEAIKIIVISEFTRSDVISTFGVTSDKISVIHEGVEKEKYQRQYSEAEKNRIRKQYRLPGKYILSVGHLEPRKNYSRLIHAFSILKKKYGIDHKLVIVGRENWKYQPIYDLVKRLRLGESVIFTRFVSDGDLPAIYQMADVFVTASTFEGFGFTPLEAMAAGTPVAASNATSLPEVIGDAGVLFNPYDEDDIAEKIYSVIGDEQFSKELVAKGSENIKRFTWEKCCRETIREYEMALE